MRDNLLRRIQRQDDLIKNTEPNKPIDAATNLGANINIVLAALSAVSHTVDIAVSPAKLAPESLETLDALQDIHRDTTLDLSSRGSQAKGLSIESHNGVHNRLDIQTEQSRADVLQLSAHIGVHVAIDLNIQLHRKIVLDTESGPLLCTYLS
ncbi:hypothetical protein E4U52_001391 [Claviceps spartinae]|nr:hypothetical protein E4U52_001391 [Claviceps spartinae]